MRIPVRKYIQITDPRLADKSDWELWELLSFEAKMYVAICYIADRIDSTLTAIAMMRENQTPSTASHPSQPSHQHQSDTAPEESQG